MRALEQQKPFDLKPTPVFDRATAVVESADREPVDVRYECPEAPTRS
jgi:hypothetical protein